MLNIEGIKKNKNIIDKKYGCVAIDSIIVEQNNQIEKIIYNDCTFHELRSCSKLLIAMAVGIAIDNKMFNLDTKIYPTIKDLVVIKNESNLRKIQQWTIKNLLTHTTGYDSQMMSERFVKNIDKDKLLEYSLNYDISYEV